MVNLKQSPRASLGKLALSVSLMLMLSNHVHAHPGHSHFGSVEEGINWLLWGWTAVIMLAAAYGGWRLYSVLSSSRRRKNKPDTDNQDDPPQ